jgi:hypothetical protein
MRLNVASMPKTLIATSNHALAQSIILLSLAVKVSAGIRMFMLDTQYHPIMIQ